MTKTPSERIERLEALEEIRQLPARYTLAADSRDIEALVALYADTGQPVYYPFGSDDIPHQQLGAWLRNSLRPYGATQHFVCNHLIDIDDDSHAHGTVYCFAGQERGDKWIVLALVYEDKYVKQEDRWYFAERRSFPWYYTDWDEKPIGPHKLRLPDRPASAAPLPDRWPTWGQFVAAETTMA